MSMSESQAPAEMTAPGIDQAQATAFLHERYGRDVTLTSALRQGAWSNAYAFRQDRSDLVIRFSRYADDFARDRLAASYATTALPIPAVVELGEAFGGFYAVSERAFGQYIDDLDGEQMHALLPALFAALDAMRAVDLSGTTGYGNWDAQGHAPFATWRETLLHVAVDDPADRGHGWREQLESSPVGASMFDEALAQFVRLVDVAPDERHLIHSDLLNFNMLVAGDRITAVIDWGCALYGDFLYDLAWFAMWAPWYPAWRDIDFAREGAEHFARIGLDVPHLDERLRCCMVHIGLGNQAYCASIGRWDQLEAIAKRTLAIARGDAR